MTRLGPLTSQALGRSPYDVVVPGEGDDDPRAPRQQFDERGRPVNPETKRINRDIVRSHNEVMQVIGVAEPETGSMSMEAESNRRILQQHYENNIGRSVWPVLRMAGTLGLWGTGPLRQRVLLYRRYDDFLPWNNYRQNYGMHALASLFVAGVPTAVAEHYLVRQWTDRGGQWISRERLLRSRLMYTAYAFIRTHLRVYTCLHRMGLVPRSQWLPHILFFLPFSSQSPIRPPPPLPATLTWPSMLAWAGQTLLGLAPIPLMCVYTEVYEWAHHLLNHLIFNKMDLPANPPVKRPAWLYSPFTAERQIAGAPPAEDPYVPGMFTFTLREREAEEDRNYRRFRQRRREQAQRRAQERERLGDRYDSLNESSSEEEGVVWEVVNGVLVTRVPGEPPRCEDGSIFVEEEDPRPRNHPERRRERARRRERDRELVRSFEEPGPDSDERRPDDDSEQSHHPPQFRSGTPAPGSPAPAHRRNTVSSAGGDVGDVGDDGDASEEEEFELSATLISFDVEAAEAGDQPPNAWSAELRQSSSAAVYDADAGGSYPNTRAHGTYIGGVFYPDDGVSFVSDTMLTRLPATIYASCTATLLTTLSMIDLEAMALRSLAWTYRLRSGQPVDDLRRLVWVPAFTVGLSCNALNHLFMSFFFQSVIDAAAIATALGVGFIYHGSNPDRSFLWNFCRAVVTKLWLGRGKKN